MTVFCILQPCITVTHLDAFSYIEGAISLARGDGYVSVEGDPLNHWPPGYSWLLSFFSRPLKASYWINAFSLAIAVFYLLRIVLRVGWPLFAGVGFASAAGFGFLSGLASSAMPEILTYAIFLGGTFSILWGSAGERRLAFIAIGLLPLLKSIAIVFVPAFILADVWTRGLKVLQQHFIEYLLGSVTLFISIGGVLLFNRLTIGEALPSSHPKPDASLLLQEGFRFFHDLFRSFLANWYGSI